MYPLLNSSEEEELNTSVSVHTSVSNDELEDSWFYPESITGREGELSPLMNAPTELFNEVASYLSPWDLLSMARSNKGLRKALMSKHSRHIWLSSERLIGLPSCPPHMSNPGYASLLFDTFCMRCLKECSERPDIWMELRFCEHCGVYNTIARPVSLPHGLTLRDLVALIPGKSSFRTINSEDWFKTSTLPLSQYYYKPHLTKILRRCGAFEGSKEEFVEECSKLLYQRKMRTIEIYTWVRQQERREIEIEYEREETISKLLLRVGYRLLDLQVVMNEPDWPWFDVMKVARPLTRTEWCLIRPQLERTILNRREHRRKADWERFKRARIDELIKECKRLFSRPDTYCHVSLSEILKLPSVSLSIESKEPYIDVFDDNWMSIEDEIHELLEERGCALNKILWKKMQGAIRRSRIIPKFHPESEERYLDFPYAFFTSKDGVLTFDDIREALSRKFLDSFSYPVTSECEDLEEALRPYFADSQTVTIAKALFDTMKTPYFTTMRCMDTLFPSGFQCTICGPLLCKPMNWHELVDHFDWERISIMTAAKSPLWEHVKHDAFHMGHMPSYWVGNPFSLVKDEEDEWESSGCDCDDSDCSECGTDEERDPINASCPICKRLGIPTSFTNELALNEHVKRKHGKNTWQEAKSWMNKTCRRTH